jgi:hypothetical protein
MPGMPGTPATPAATVGSFDPGCGSEIGLCGVVTLFCLSRGACNNVSYNNTKIKKINKGYKCDPKIVRAHPALFALKRALRTTTLNIMTLMFMAVKSLFF